VFVLSLSFANVRGSVHAGRPGGAEDRCRHPVRWHRHQLCCCTLSSCTVALARGRRYYKFKGIPRFYDINGFLVNPEIFQLVIDTFAARYKDAKLTSSGLARMHPRHPHRPCG
jgi:hypothetical protein